MLSKSNVKKRQDLKLLFISAGVFHSFYTPLFPYHLQTCSIPLNSLNFNSSTSLPPLISSFSHLVFSISLSIFITLVVLMTLECYYVSSALFCSLVFYYIPCCTAFYFVTACCLDVSLFFLETHLDEGKIQY